MELLALLLMGVDMVGKWLVLLRSRDVGLMVFVGVEYIGICGLCVYLVGFVQLIFSVTTSADGRF